MILQETINWAAPYIGYEPLTIGGMEPAMTNANIVKSTILGPPFAWRWNRAELAFALVSGPPATQDYAEALADFGFVEKAWLVNAANADIKEITAKEPLAKTKEVGRPAYVAAQVDDNAGNITFRFQVLPDENYTASILYQKKPVPLTSLASAWDPIPDSLAYIYQWGFLALAVGFNDDRFPMFNQKFLSSLLGAQDGLDEIQRNIFLGNWLDITKAAQRAPAKATQGVASHQL